MIFGIPDLRIASDPYIDIDTDRAKGRALAAEFDSHDFAGLVSWYYAHTSVVPPADAARYTRGLLGAAARAESALEDWERGTPAGANRRLLEIGCGTGPLLVAASRRFTTAVGVDIAFRWLVVAKKRLAEAAVEVPLICAGAEALPFPDASYDVVAAESSLEVLQDLDAALAEAHRVLAPRGHLYFTMPNRLSLGPDPHVGVWAAGWLPESFVFRRVLREGGIAPKRQLLSLAELRSRLGKAGFARPRVFAPDVPAGQRAVLSAPLRMIVAVYRMVRSVSVGRWLLLTIGPLISGTAERRSAA